jgi:hypothetical protein
MKFVVPTALSQFRKAEPSRSASGIGSGIGMAPTNKLRARAHAGLGELGAEQQILQRMQRMTDETAEPPRHVVTVTDITRGLGLPPEDAERVQRAVSDTNVEFTPKMQTQKLMGARSKIIELLRSMKIEGDARLEIGKRVASYWRKQYDTDLNREPVLRFVSWKAQPPQELLRLRSRANTSARQPKAKKLPKPPRAAGKSPQRALFARRPTRVLGAVMPKAVR